MKNLKLLLLSIIVLSLLFLVACGKSKDSVKDDDRSDVESPVEDAPHEEQHNVEAPHVEPPKVEAPHVEPPEVEPPHVEPPEVEPPKVKVPEVNIKTDDKKITMEVPDNVLFDFDKSDLRPEAKNVLDKIAEALQEYDGADVQINGHTDNVGQKQYNMNLSEERAESVHAYLDDNGTLDHLNVKIKGYGDTKPIVPNDTKANQQKNRRVEIVIEPKT
ncbi:OmpA family protein [Pseudogracilibacillus sp. SO30301A]|uniref:OmpA family protein n=1 Tax=Pseudogracilibacillus sp. SO30301A TaxID=3098291 RepID=UPI00300E549E